MRKTVCGMYWFLTILDGLKAIAPLLRCRPDRECIAEDLKQQGMERLASDVEELSVPGWRWATLLEIPKALSLYLNGFGHKLANHAWAI